MAFVLLKNVTRTYQKNVTSVYQKMRRELSWKERRIKRENSAVQLYLFDG